MAFYITLNVGKTNYAMETGVLPPVGTRIVAHKHFYDGGTYPVLEVIEHEWRLEEGGEDATTVPVFDITVKTRIVEG